jgi:hypothetical protein
VFTNRNGVTTQETCIFSNTDVSKYRLRQIFHRLHILNSMLPVELVIFSFLSSFLVLLLLAAILVVNCHGGGSFKGIVTNARSGNRFSGGRGGLCWLAGFCLVVDLKCGFVETVTYPMGFALYILCNTLLSRSVMCCIFVRCCFCNIITLFL